MKTLSIFSILAFLISCDASKTTTTQTTTTSSTSTSTTQSVDVKTDVKTIDFVSALELKQMVSFMASDDLKGRDTGSEGINEAANYIENKFKAYGLKPYFETYRDNFKVGDLDAYNVVAHLEGTDPKLKNEFIIIGAHYDHIGTAKDVNGDTIANGANDNAAGTSGVLALAKYFSENKTNKRSIIFTTFTAEEKGLLGSKHLAERLLKNNINLYTMINIEMIGVPFVGRDYQAFITGHELSNLGEKMNAYAGENLIGASDVAKKYGLFKRSDNYPFYQAFKVPSHTVSSCDLTNFDFYHHVDDEVDKLDYKFMASLINKLAPVLEQMTNTPTQEIKMHN